MFHGRDYRNEVMCGELLFERMTDVAVTVDAGKHFTIVFAGQHLVYDIGMTVKTGALRYPAVARFDLNRFMKVLECECQRMEKAVVALNDPFADWVMRQVAIVAHGNVPMARVLPRVVVALHHMTVGAGGRIVAEITPALAVPERERADAAKDANEHGEEDGKECGAARPLANRRWRLAWAGCVDNGIVHKSLRAKCVLEYASTVALSILAQVEILNHWL
jgi:hypothetical protein